jgi:very-short-patch-repair endonuclease
MRVPNRGALALAKRLRQISTGSEEALWERLRDRQLLGLKLRRQVPIGPYIADFYCHELRLEEKAQISHDVNRDANLRALGYRVLRVTNREIQDHLESVLEAIRHLYRHRTSQPG